MNLKAKLYEYVSRKTKQTPKVSFETSHDKTLNCYTVTLNVWSARWVSDTVDDEVDGRAQVLLNALKDLKSLRSETAVRVLLKLEPVYRNPEIEEIRRAIKALRKFLKNHDRVDMVPLLVKIYPIIDKLEAEMQTSSISKLPSKGSTAYNYLYGISEQDNSQDAIAPIEAAKRADKYFHWYEPTANSVEANAGQTISA